MKSSILFRWATHAAFVLVCIAVHYASECIGGGSAMAPTRGDMLLGWVPIAMAGLSAAGSILGGLFGNRQKRKQRRALEARQRKLDAWRDAALGSDYLARADSQAALRAVRENIDEQLKAVDTSAIKGGMTDEARAAYASRLNRGYADVVSQIAGLGDRYRDRVRDSYMQQSNAVEDAKMGLNSTSGAENIVSGITGAAGTIASIIGGGGGRGVTTGSVQPSATVKEMAASGHLPGNEFLSEKYKITL